MPKKIVNNVLELPDGKIADEILGISDLRTSEAGVDYYTVDISVRKPEELKFVQELTAVLPQIGWYYTVRDGVLKPVETEQDIKRVEAADRNDVKLYSLKA